MKKIIAGFFVMTMLLVLCACENKRSQKDPYENVIELATDARAVADVDEKYATADFADPEIPDDEMPDGSAEPEPSEPTAEPTEEPEDPYFYTKKDGSVGLCNYNEVSYHKQNTEAEDTELQKKLDETREAVSKMEGKELTELTDELVAKYYEYKSVAALKDAYKKMIEESKEEKAETAYKNEILSYIVDNSCFNSDLTEKSCTYYASLYSYYNAQAVTKNMSFDQYVEEAYGTNAADFKKNIAKDATELACRTEALLAIAEAEKIEITDEVYEAKIKLYMEKFGYTDRELFEKEYSKDVIEFNILQDLAFDYVLGKARSV